MKPIKACRICDVLLVKGDNWYESSAKYRLRMCNKCMQAAKLERKSRKRREKTVGSPQHLADMLHGARSRARKNNLAFSLKTQDLRDIITNECPILGIKFELNKQNLSWGTGENRNNWQTSPSLDRILPDKGYTKDNVVIVSLMANSIKNQASPNQIQKVATFYKKLYKEKGIRYDT